MYSLADGNKYEDVFVFEDLVYAMECQLCVVHVYRNRNNSLTRQRGMRYACKGKDRYFSHSIIVTNEHIIQSCIRDNLISILDRSGELLQTKHTADILGKILISNLFTNRLLIAHADQPSSQLRVINFTGLPDGDGCSGAVWLIHSLYVASGPHLLTFTPAK